MSFNAKELKEKYNPDGSVTYKMQQRMLDLLKVIDAICRKHNMQYWLSGGTMLGAIRHQGFIPWDDDLDIEMFRPDFEKNPAIRIARQHPIAMAHHRQELFFPVCQG